jgi:hypothetical protein
LSDPRKEPNWKQKRYEERVLLLLGAILDALEPKAEIPKTTLTRRKPNA